MGLCLVVGYLADLIQHDEEGAERFRQELLKINRYLSTVGLPQHKEPESCEGCSYDMYGYSGLSYLRRVAAYLNLKGHLPAPGDESAPNDPVLEEYYDLIGKPEGGLLSRMLGRKSTTRHFDQTRQFDHLIYHSDTEGYYLPIDFPDVLFPSRKWNLAGGIGSAIRLYEECARLAKALELPTGLDPGSVKVWDAVEAQGQGVQKWQRYGIESFTCLCLLNACDCATTQKSVLVFR